MGNSARRRLAQAMLQLFIESLVMVGITALALGTAELAMPYPLVCWVTIVVAISAAYLSVLRIYATWSGAYLIADLHVWFVALLQSVASLRVQGLACSIPWQTATGNRLLPFASCNPGYQGIADYKGYVGAIGIMFLMIATLVVWGWCRYKDWQAWREWRRG